MSDNPIAPKVTEWWCFLAGVVTATSFFLWRNFMNERSETKDGKAAIKNGWFSEFNSQWPGQVFSLKIKKLLYKGTSEYQDVLCVETENYGKALMIDGVIQCTERDEFAYHEMMVHVAMHCHPNPKQILVIGGGDGGTVRELCRHGCVARIDVCELDEMVIRASEAHMHSLSKGFSDPRVRVIIEDGFSFVRQHRAQYDIIIVDSSDPVGPAQILFSDLFYEYLSEAVTADGIIVAQAECMWLSGPLIRRLLSYGQKYFKHAEYSYFSVPSYPCGTIGIAVCSKSRSCKTPLREPSPALLAQLKYYDSEVHTASFVHPKFLKKELTFAPHIRH